VTEPSFTYELDHPDLSEPLVIESAVPRTPRALAAWAVLYVLREFDEALAMDDFTVTEVNPPTIDA
jgi:hypothetical protein